MITTCETCGNGVVCRCPIPRIPLHFGVGQPAPQTGESTGVEGESPDLQKLSALDALTALEHAMHRDHEWVDWCPECRLGVSITNGNYILDSRTEI